ncbi:MAG: DUF3047 domain-containing protein [Desulfobacteraceae bacterium]|jgi:hypothetical protein
MALSGLMRGAFLLIFFLSLTPARASERMVVADFSSGVDANGVPLGWQLKKRSGKADFAIIKDGHIHAVHLRSMDSSFALQKLVKVNTRKYPVLSWKWKVTKLPRGADLRTPKADDQAAQLFLAFSDAKVIVYLWDTTAPEGLMGDVQAPPFVTIKAIVLRSGYMETGKWITETRNAHQDYRMLFDREPPPVVGMRLQINSQHTDTSAESYFADVVFKKQ